MKDPDPEVNRRANWFADQRLARRDRQFSHWTPREPPPPPPPSPVEFGQDAELEGLEDILEEHTD